MAATKKLPDIDANTLFENHSVDEVRLIERKLRHDIEWKKEEMRDLVGERYRDLISAADTIKQMKSCAENISTKLKDLEGHCQKLKQYKQTDDESGTPTSSHRGSRAADRGGNRAADRLVYEVACEVRLLLAVPGWIWKYLDAGQYLHAAKLYLLAKHIHSCLRYDTHSGGQVLSRFPVIAKQWAAISHFKSAIMIGCKRVLSDYSVSVDGLTSALSSILILEDKSPRQVFQDFLISRMYSGKGSSGARNHIISALQLIHSTIIHITSVFCQGQPEDLGSSNQLANTLSQILNTPLIEQLDISELSAIRHHLPKSVTEFKLSLRIEEVSLTSDYLKSSCDQWINSCLSNVKSHIKEQLNYVTTIKSLTSIREAVSQVYIEDSRLKYWSEACTQVLTNPVNVWREELLPLYIQRMSEIVAEQFHSIIINTESQLNKAKELITSTPGNGELTQGSLKWETDMSSFIWTESGGDLPQMDNWISASQKSFLDGGGLLMKAHGFTPIVQSLCNKLNKSLSTFLSDVQTFQQREPFTESPQQREEVMALLGDSYDATITDMIKFVSDETYQYCVKLCDKIRKELDDEKAGQTSHSYWLFLARVSSAIPKLCPNLKKCVTLLTSNDKTAASSKSMSRSSSRVTQYIDPLWLEACELFDETCNECYNLWGKYTVEDVSSAFSESLPSKELSSLLEHVTRWDEIEISEVSEEGQLVKSIISVPMQMSTSLLLCLNSLCDHMNSVGSHCIPRKLQYKVVSQTLHKILLNYKRIAAVDDSTSQPPYTAQQLQSCALQYLFDILYIQGLVLWRHSEQNSEIEGLMTSLIEELQGRVDPFDLDVFTPHIQKHVSSQRYRHQILFGAVAEIDRMTSSRQLQNTSRTDHHNILALHSSSSSRFPLLPVISDNNRTNYTASSKHQPQTSTAAPKVLSRIQDEETLSAGSALSKIRSEPIFKQSASFYDRLGSGAMSWFTGGSTK